MTGDITVAILACAGVTIAVRTLPLVFLSGITLPAIVRDWLGFIPAAVMASIVAMDLVERWQLNSVDGSIALVATSASIMTGLLIRSLFATISIGVAFYLVLHTVFT